MDNISSSQVSSELCTKVGGRKQNKQNKAEQKQKQLRAMHDQKLKSILKTFL